MDVEATTVTKNTSVSMPLDDQVTALEVAPIVPENSTIKPAENITILSETP